MITKMRAGWKVEEMKNIREKSGKAAFASTPAVFAIEGRGVGGDVRSKKKPRTQLGFEPKTS